MAQTYLLTTPDGEKIHVETSQAGDTIVTPSGKTVIVPTLREMRKLPLVSQEVTPTKRQWGLGQSIVLVLGLLITLAAGLWLTSFLLVFRAPFEEVKAELDPRYVEALEGDVEQWDLPKMLDFWSFATHTGALDELRSNGVGDRGTIEIVQERQEYRTIAIGAVIVGLLVMVSAFFIPGTKVPS